MLPRAQGASLTTTRMPLYNTLQSLPSPPGYAPLSTFIPTHQPTHTLMSLHAAPRLLGVLCVEVDYQYRHVQAQPV
jgi:hypothetical protein